MVYGLRFVQGLRLMVCLGFRSPLSDQPPDSPPGFSVLGLPGAGVKVGLGLTVEEFSGRMCTV
jgi:hypothetical protein